jgi:AcrR family transcriptional regulator
MPGRERTNPRKRPRQRRAIATVDAIVEAAAYILSKDGWEGFTTNRVAERAGVNIASLYQYFPGKEAIVAELQRRHRGRVREALPDVTAALRTRGDLRSRLRLIVEAAVQEHAVAPALHRVFEEELPRRVRRHAGADEADERRFWNGLVRPFMRNVPDPDLAVFICRAASHAVIHQAASERPDLLADPLFAAEVTALLERYLRRG